MSFWRRLQPEFSLQAEPSVRGPRARIQNIHIVIPAKAGIQWWGKGVCSFPRRTGQAFRLKPENDILNNIIYKIGLTVLYIWGIITNNCSCILLYFL
jgi:hypothetical protein